MKFDMNLSTHGAALHVEAWGGVVMDDGVEGYQVDLSLPGAWYSLDHRDAVLEVLATDPELLCMIGGKLDDRALRRIVSAAAKVVLRLQAQGHLSVERWGEGVQDGYWRYDPPRD